MPRCDDESTVPYEVKFPTVRVRSTECFRQYILYVLRLETINLLITEYIASYPCSSACTKRVAGARELRRDYLNMYACGWRGGGPVQRSSLLAQKEGRDVPSRSGARRRARAPPTLTYLPFYFFPGLPGAPPGAATTPPRLPTDDRRPSARGDIQIGGAAVGGRDARAGAPPGRGRGGGGGSTVILRWLPL